MSTGRMVVTLGMSVILLSTAVPAIGQAGQGAADRPVASRPWPPARLADGQPDVQGVWAAQAGGSVSLSNPISGGMDLQRRLAPGKELRLPSRLIDPPDGLVPYQPWAEARRKQQEGSYDHPTQTRAHRHAAPLPARRHSRGSTRMCRRSGSFRRQAPWCSSGMNITHTASFLSTAGRASRPT